MRRTLLLLTLLMLACSAPAMAQGGFNIAWGDDCWSDNPINSRYFACNTNSGYQVVCVSFSPSRDWPEFVGAAVYLHGFSSAPGWAIPDWWAMYTDVSACRSGAISVNADFTSGGGGACADLWGGGGGGGLGAYWNSGTYVYVPTVWAIPDALPITAGQEYYALKVIFTNAKTVGTGACSGCSDVWHWAVEKVEVASWNESEWLLTPLPDGNGVLDWQSGVVPTRNTTWGGIKSLYR